MLGTAKSRSPSLVELFQPERTTRTILECSGERAFQTQLMSRCGGGGGGPSRHADCSLIWDRHSPRAVVTKTCASGGLKPQKLILLSFRGLEAQGPGVSRAVPPPKGRGTLPPPDSGGRQRPRACGGVAPISASVVTWPPLLCLHGVVSPRMPGSVSLSSSFS